MIQTGGGRDSLQQALSGYRGAGKWPCLFQQVDGFITLQVHKTREQLNVTFWTREEMGRSKIFSGGHLRNSFHAAQKSSRSEAEEMAQLLMCLFAGRRTCIWIPAWHFGSQPVPQH